MFNQKLVCIKRYQMFGKERRIIMKTKFFGKSVAVAISVLMLFGGMHIGVQAEPYIIEATDGYFWLEAENGEKSGYWEERAETANTQFNGDKALVVNTAESIDGEHSVSYEINVTEADTYSVYLYGTQLGNAWQSASELTIDGNEVTLAKASGTEDKYLDDVWCFNWNEGSVALTAGKHTIKYTVVAPRENGNDLYIGCIDSICLVSSNGSFRTEIDARPTIASYKDFTNGYLWADETAFETIISCSTIGDSGFYGGNAYSYEMDRVTGTKHEFSYLVNVPETAEYLLAVNGSMNSNTWQSTIKVKVDDVVYPLTNTGTSRWVGNMQCSWNTATAEITAGKHKITILIDGGSQMNANLYKYAIDALCISRSDWNWTPDITVMPVAPTEISSIWLEETDSQRKASVYGSTADNTFSEGYAATASTATAPDASGYTVDYSVYIKNTGDYDIYYRSNVENEWMSYPDVIVDGVKQESARVRDEGWVVGSYTLGWNKTTVALDRGEHLVQFALIDSRQSSTNNWIGLFDCMVIVPKDTPFNPIANNITNTKIDYELCEAMVGQNLDEVINDIELPPQTKSGQTITWVSDNKDVITDSGVITRGTVDKSATLTATCNGYSKEFVVNVKKITEFDVISFDITGDIIAGQTINTQAVLKFNGNTSKKAMAIIALYAETGEMIASNVVVGDITNVATPLNAALKVPETITSGTRAKAFLWYGLDDLKPIVKGKEK